MKQLYLGSYENLLGGTVYFKSGEQFMQCLCAAYSFKTRNYTLTPISKIDGSRKTRSSFQTDRVYIEVED